MPRELIFKSGDHEYKAVPVKVDRKKLYGWSELRAEDQNGQRLDLLTADESGKYIMAPGGTANGVVTADGEWIERSELRTVDVEGNEAQLYTSTFTAGVELTRRVSTEELLDHSITDFYQLSGAESGLIDLVGDDIYEFPYTYNDGYDPSPAFIMNSAGGLFMLTGVKNKYEMLCFADCDTIDDDHDDRLSDDDDELDFNIFA